MLRNLSLYVLQFLVNYENAVIANNMVIKKWIMKKNKHT